MNYAVTLNGQRVLELFDAATAPPEAVAISQEDGIMLSSQSRFGDWKLIGGTLELDPPPTPVIVPGVVSRFQAKAALMNAGLLPSVVAVMAQASPTAQLAWNEAVEFRRNSPTVLAMGQALSLSSQQLDDLFIAAALITA